jgi:hypothetical protein
VTLDSIAAPADSFTKTAATTLHIGARASGVPVDNTFFFLCASRWRTRHAVSRIFHL